MLRSRTCRQDEDELHLHAELIGIAEMWDVSLIFTVVSSVWLTDPGQPAATAVTASVGNPAHGACRMIAIFDYDPRESSPNTDIEVRCAHAYFVQRQSLASVCAHHLSLFITKGWTDLQRWRHHSCVRWHGRGWLLLCKCWHGCFIVIINMKIAGKYYVSITLTVSKSSLQWKFCFLTLLGCLTLVWHC